MFICASFECEIAKLQCEILCTVLFSYNSCCIFNAAMLKHQLAGSLSKKTLTIEEKIKVIDAKKKTRQSWKQLADQFCIGKTAAAKIIKIEASIMEKMAKIGKKSLF